jgi:lipoate synthase
MRFYSDLEVELLIEDLTEAAHEAIELAASEAARAAFLESLERETTAIREAANYRIEVQELRRTGVRNTVVTGIICFLGGLVTGLLINK